MTRRKLTPETTAYRVVISELIKYAQDVDIGGAVAWLTRYFSQARQH